MLRNMRSKLMLFRLLIYDYIFKFELIFDTFLMGQTNLKSTGGGH